MDHRYNNFNFLRLLAAAQVVFVHSFGYTDLYDTGPDWARMLFEVVLLFPGVPIFFVCSGFLISMSWERSSGGLGSYFWKRFLRIYPAMVVCFAVSLLLLLAAGYLTREFVWSRTFLAWIGGQLTVAQFFNPVQLRGFGLGVLNGSLWTIIVEIQFYVAVPLLYVTVFGRWQGTWLARIVLAVAFLGSLITYQLMDTQIVAAGGFRTAVMQVKVLHNTLLPHLWMFLLGVVALRHFDKLYRWVEGKFVFYLVAYVALAALLGSGSGGGVVAVFLERVMLALVVLSAAYTRRGLADRLLRGNDISYGVYLYHYLVINTFVEFGWMGTMAAIPWIYAITVALACASWRYIERPAIRLKGWRPGDRWSWRPVARGSDLQSAGRS